MNRLGQNLLPRAGKGGNPLGKKTASLAQGRTPRRKRKKKRGTNAAQKEGEGLGNIRKKEGAHASLGGERKKGGIEYKN